MTNSEKVDRVKIVTPEFRVSFPQVFEAKAVNPGDKVKFTVQMLFRVKADLAKLDEKPVDLAPLKNAVVQVLVQKFGPDKTKWPKGLRIPFRDGKEKDYDGYGEGVVFCTATSLMKPGLVDAALQPIISPSDFYGGCYARATVNPYYYDTKGNKGVAFGLQNIQKIRDGEPFSGRGKPENDFDAIDVPASVETNHTEDPLEGIGA